MCPYPYYTVMREVTAPKHLRLRLVLYAKSHGIKPAARAFATTVKTVRKWLRRFDGTVDSLGAASRRPHRQPRKLPPASERKIVELKQKLPRWAAQRLKDQFGLPFSVKAIRRVCRDHGLTRKYRRRKHQTKRLLREVKKTWALFQQSDIDTKNLCDIPEYWEQMKPRDLPQYQYTFREVTSGLLFLGFSNELSLTYSELFARQIISHLQACRIDLGQATWQSDNGSEFVGSWQAKGDSAFTKLIESVPGQKHRTIPPGAHRFQADVETVHNLMEAEFYEIEYFRDRKAFLQKATWYQAFFNLARKNSAKENKTPWELILQKNPTADPRLPLFQPVFLDEIYYQRLNTTSPRGYDVWALPCFLRGVFRLRRDAIGIALRSRVFGLQRRH
jgi:transposase